MQILLILIRSRTSGPLTLSWQRSLSYRNQFIDLQSKSIDWFLYDKGIRHERVNLKLCIRIINRYLHNYHQTAIQREVPPSGISNSLNVNWIFFVDCKFVVINFSRRPFIRHGIPSAKNILYMSNRIFIVSSNVGIPPSSLGKQIQRYTNSFQSSGLWKILEWPPFFLRNIIKHICDLIAVRMVIDIIGPHIIGPQRFLGRWNDFQSLRRTYHSSTSV